MITLNTDKGLVKIESWDDIESRPGFVKNIDPAKHKLASIIGRYIFKEKIRCGLSNCHTPHATRHTPHATRHMPHAKGYIVATTEGLETNIGKDCGTREFSVDFETLSKKFERDITQKEYRDTLWSFSYQLEELEKRSTELRRANNGADWIYDNTRPLINRNSGCPDEVVRMITSMIKTRSNVIFTEREATSNEIDNLEAIENRTLRRPHYIEVPIAELVGVEALYPENNLREILVKDLETNIRHFKEKDINSLTYAELKHWVKWIGSVEITLDKAVNIVAMGCRLLDRANLSPFLNILDRKEDDRLFRKYLRSLSDVV